MGTSDMAMRKIVNRCERIGWKVENSEGRRTAWAYRITRPDGGRVQIHRSPSDVNWETVVLRQLNEGGLMERAEKEHADKQRRDRDRKLAADKAKNDAAIAKAEREAALIARAAGPLAGPREFDAAWLLTPTDIPDTRWGVMTPELARKLLTTINVSNRPKRENRTEFFVNVINDGDWGATHQGGAIDSTGKLQDAQHRLEAIEQTGKPQIMQMTVGMPPENFRKVDSPLVRTAIDAAVMRGEKDVRTLTATARLIIQFDRFGMHLHTRGSKVAVSIDTVDRGVIAMGDELREAVARANRIRREIKIPPTALAAAIFLIGRRLPKGDPRVEQFFTDIADGAEIPKYDGVWLLRRHFNRLESGGERTTQLAALAYLIKAWNLRAAGRTVQALVWRSNELFPANIFLPPPPGSTAPIIDTEESEAA